MKKLMVLLVAAVLIGQLSLAEWKEFPQTEFLQYLARMFCQKTGCNQARIGAMEVRDKVFFFGDCLDADEVEL